MLGDVVFLHFHASRFEVGMKFMGSPHAASGSPGYCSAPVSVGGALRPTIYSTKHHI